MTTPTPEATSLEAALGKEADPKSTTAAADKPSTAPKSAAPDDKGPVSVDKPAGKRKPDDGKVDRMKKAKKEKDEPDTTVNSAATGVMHSLTPSVQAQLITSDAAIHVGAIKVFSKGGKAETYNVRTCGFAEVFKLHAEFLQNPKSPENRFSGNIQPADLELFESLIPGVNGKTRERPDDEIIALLRPHLSEGTKG